MLTSVAWVDWSAGSLPPESLWFGKFDVIYFGASCLLGWSSSWDQLLLLTFFLVLMCLPTSLRHPDLVQHHFHRRRLRSPPSRQCRQC